MSVDELTKWSVCAVWRAYVDTSLEYVENSRYRTRIGYTLETYREFQRRKYANRYRLMGRRFECSQTLAQDAPRRSWAVVFAECATLTKRPHSWQAPRGLRLSSWIRPCVWNIRLQVRSLETGALHETLADDLESLVFGNTIRLLIFATLEQDSRISWPQRAEFLEN